MAHGSPRLTNDVDVVYGRDDENLRRLAAALAPHQPYLRGAPRDFLFVGTLQLSELDSISHSRPTWVTSTCSAK